VIVKGFRKCCVSTAVDGTDDMLWNDSEEDGDVSVRQMEALTVKMETVTLIGKGRQNVTCFVYKCVKLIVKYFFLAHIIFGRSS
jgi:hypothetical protein